MLYTQGVLREGLTYGNITLHLLVVVPGLWKLPPPLPQGLKSERDKAEVILPYGKRGKWKKQKDALTLWSNKLSVHPRSDFQSWTQRESKGLLKIFFQHAYVHNHLHVITYKENLWEHNLEQNQSEHCKAQITLGGPAFKPVPRTDITNQS